MLHTHYNKTNKHKITKITKLQFLTTAINNIV
jgi:hypothetical protein